MHRTIVLSAWVALAVTGPALASPYSDAVLADSPLAYWRLGDPAGSSTAANHYAASVPEPASATLLAMVSLGIWTRRRRM